jgi:hypothetical protein
MPIPEATGLQDLNTAIIYPPNLGKWANLASTREITLSSNVLNTTTNVSVIVGNVSFGNLTISNTNYYANTNVVVLGTTTSNIANISVGMRVYGANIGSNVTVTSIRNSAAGSTWENWHQWISAPAGYFLWNSPIIDNGTNITFNCLITTEAVGNVSYTIRTTNTGFDGNDTVTTANIGDIDITAFSGRFLCVTANVRAEGSLHSLTSLDVNVTNEKLTIVQGDLDTSTLSGTSSSRQLDLGRAVSYIYNIQMTPHLTTSFSGYTASGYVTNDYFTETAVTGAFPQIIDKLNGGANIAVVDNDGNYVDTTLDLVAYALPEQYMDGINLKQR